MQGVKYPPRASPVPAQTTPTVQPPPLSLPVSKRESGSLEDSTTKFPRQGLWKVIHHGKAPGEWGGGVAVGGRGRLAGPQLPCSATCKQALGGRRLLQPCFGLGLGTGNWGLRLGAAHPAQSQASAAPSSTCLLPAPVPSQGTVSLHTPPFPLPAPRYCIVRCVRAAPSGKAPRAPRSFCPRVHLAAPPSPSKAERRNALETHQTHLGMAENRTQLEFFFF